MADKATKLKERGNALLAQGDVAGASAAYTEALSSCPEGDRAARRILRSNRSAARLQAGDADGALKDAEECLNLGPGWSKGLYRKGAALSALGKFSEAVSVLESALLGEPNNQTYTAALNQAKSALENPEVAAQLKREYESKAVQNKMSNDATAAGEEDPLDALFAEVAEIEQAGKAKVLQVDHEKETEGWTSANQIERLLQKHHKFLNLNPFHVFGIAHEANEEDFKKRYHKLSALVHPDKNPDDSRAHEAFDIVKKAYDTLKDDGKRNLFLETFAVCRNNVENSRAVLLRELRNNEALLIEKHGTFEAALDLEIKRVLALNEHERIKAEKIRAANEEAIARSQMAKETNWAEVKKNLDEHREGTDERVQNWAKFQKNAKRQKFG